MTMLRGTAPEKGSGSHALAMWCGYSLDDACLVRQA